MDTMRKGPESSTLSPGRVVALVAGLSVGAGVGYMVYRHLSSTDVTCESPASPLPYRSLRCTKEAGSPSLWEPVLREAERN